MYVDFLLKEQQGKFKSEFENLPIEKLVECFNKQVRCLTGNSIREVYLDALKDELLNRDFDCSLVLNKYGLKLLRKVRLQDNHLVYQQE
jgi:hypothetical protein